MRFIPVFLIPLLLTACGKPSAEESFLAGEDAQQLAESAASEAVQDSLFRIAIENFEAVVVNHPDDVFAEPALFRVAELHNNGTRQFHRAIDTYRHFRTIYPASPQAPVSLFMVGFLYNNELGQYREAAAAYNEFLNSYPDHELATSASAELENLGKSPEEIIEQQLALTKDKERGKSDPDPEQMNP